jgi:hypothetical protein
MVESGIRSSWKLFKFLLGNDRQIIHGTELFSRELADVVVMDMSQIWKTDFSSLTFFWSFFPEKKNKISKSN